MIITWDNRNENPEIDAKVILIYTLMQRLLWFNFEIDGDDEATGSDTSSAGEIEDGGGV
jgi:hypothetical protein